MNRILISLLIANIIIGVSLFSQTNLRGKIIDSTDKGGIQNASVIITYEGNGVDIQEKEFFSDKSGIFNAPVDIALPNFVTIKVNAMGYKEYLREKFFVDVEELGEINLTDATKITIQRIDEITKPIVANVTNQTAERIQQISNSVEDRISAKEKEKLISGLKYQQNLVNLLNDSINSLYYELESKIIDEEVALARVKDIEKQLLKIEDENNQLDSYVGELEREVYIAYMRAVDCYCESYDNNSITIGFRLVDRNGYDLLPSTQTFSMWIYKLESISSTKQSEKSKRRPLIDKKTGQSYVEREIRLPAERILLTLETAGKEFRGGSNNYYVEIYNNKFDKPLNSLLEISSLKYECFKRDNFDLPSKLNNRNIDLTNKVEVRTDSIEIIVSDYQFSDGDIISLNLNNTWILEKYELSANETVINVKLNQEKNFLILQAENLGRRPPNTARIKVIARDIIHEVKLRADLEKSEALEIVKVKN